MSPARGKRSLVKDAGGVVTRLGKLVRDRVREFASEADGELRATLDQTREDLDAELGTGRKRVGDAAPPADGPAQPENKD